MNTAGLEQCCEILCEHINWQRPDLQHTEAIVAYHADEPTTAAVSLVKHLRHRPKPKLGFPLAFIDQLRKQSSTETHSTAKQQMDDYLAVPFLGGSWPDGRETFLCAKPQTVLIGAASEHFLAFAEQVAANRDSWQTAAHHTAGNIARFLQLAWNLPECPDEALPPLFAFLAEQVDKEWQRARAWHDGMLSPDGHNWWVMEFGRFWEIGLFFPELKGFDRFRAFFPTFFENQIRTLIAPDGFTRECSVSYHTGTSDIFLDITRMAQHNGLALSPAFMERLRKMYDVEWKLITPDGSYPAFGDCFSGPGYTFDRLPSIAAILGIGEAKWLAEHLSDGIANETEGILIERLHYPSIGEDLRPAYEQLEAVSPPECDFALSDSGYYVMRQDWGRHADYAAIEASAKGNVVASHGHGCIFDLKLYSRGRPILIGNGKGPDGSTEPERTWRHQSFSHSVATVDDEHHLPLRSVYRFANVVKPTVDMWRSEPSFVYFSGAHEAYARLDKPVPVCRRKLFYLRDNYWILIDRFTVADPGHTHCYRQRFQVGVPSRMLPDHKVQTEGAGGNLLFVPLLNSCDQVTCEPIPYPYEGHPTPDQLIFTHTATGHCIMAALLVPFQDTAPSVDVQLLDVQTDDGPATPWEITALQIDIDGRRDVYVDQHMAWHLPWRAGDYTGDGRLFHSSC